MLSRRRHAPDYRIDYSGRLEQPGGLIYYEPTHLDHNLFEHDHKPYRATSVL